MTNIPRDLEATNPDRRTAVLIVAGEDSAPERAFEEIQRLFGDYFDQIVFMTIGLVDYPVVDSTKAAEVGTYVRHTARGALSTCVDQARKVGMAAVTCVAVGTDPVEEVDKLSTEFARRCPSAMFFLGKLVFQNQKWYHPLLHGRTAESIQRRLERHGLPLAVLPIVVPL